MRRVPICLVYVGLIALATPARAESSSAHGSGALSASASVDFRIIIPPVLALRVTPATAAAPGMALDTATPQVRVARTGITLGVPAAGGAGGITLASNMRQVTIVQQSGPPTTVTVTTP